MGEGCGCKQRRMNVYLPFLVILQNCNLEQLEMSLQSYSVAHTNEYGTIS